MDALPATVPDLGPSASGPPAGPDLEHRLRDDPAALHECYERDGRIVLAYLRRLVGPDDAEDVLQQTFLDVWRSRTRYDPDRPLLPWIMTIAHRRAIDHLRHRGRHETMLVSLSEPDTVTTDVFVETFAEAEVIAAALGELPEEQRETLALAYFDDLTQTQIAARMKVPLGTVKARSARALRRMAALLVPEEDQ